MLIVGLARPAVMRGEGQSPAKDAQGRVHGTLVDAAGNPRPGVHVFLQTAFVMERDSSGNYHHATTLPAKVPFIWGSPSDEKPVSTKTDSRGRFDFSGVRPGRYMVGVKRTTPAASGESAYDTVYAAAGVMLFDLTPGQTWDTGRVVHKPR